MKSVYEMDRDARKAWVKMIVAEAEYCKARSEYQKLKRELDKRLEEDQE